MVEMNRLYLENYNMIVDYLKEIIMGLYFTESDLSFISASVPYVSQCS